MSLPVIGPSSLASTQKVRVPCRLAGGWWHALVLDARGAGLHHYLRAQDRPDRPWVRGEVLIPDAVGPGALVVAQGLLHALVPEADGIAHLVTEAGPRSRAATQPATWRRLSGPLMGTAVSAMTTSGRGVLAVTTDAFGVDLWRFDRIWVREFSVPGATAGVAASGALVVERDGRLDWWRHQRQWVRVSTIARAGTGPVSLAADAGGWLLAVPRGDVVETQRLGRDGSITRHATLTWGAGPIEAVALVPAGRGTLDALTAEEGSVFQHRRHTAHVPWLRVSCLRLHDTNPFTSDPVESAKLAQVSGDIDTQPVRAGERRPTLSRSRATAGVRGTDLGVRIDHAGTGYLLFGDTHWQRRPWLTTRDAIARVEPTGPLLGLPGVTFHGAPLRVVGGGVTMREYDVPLDAFSVGDDLYAFFTSNHFARGQVMGRSVLARLRGPLRVDPRSRRPITFEFARTFSERYFINVSVQRLPRRRLGLDGPGEVLAVWGSGSYRAGDLRLAALDPDTFDVRYWAGAASPHWSPHEADARPLLHPGAFGEISVRWVPEAGRYLMLACSGQEDPIGRAVTLRTSATPWGPWSPRQRLLDWVARGMSFGDPAARFIKAHGDGSDPVGDRIFRGQADATGAAYAPYFFDATRDGNDLVLRYTLSTWNPYQVVLMQHRLTDLGRPAPQSGSVSEAHG